jgi:hypothetical protein
LAGMNNRLFFGGDLPFSSISNDIFANLGFVTPPNFITLPTQLVRFHALLSGNQVNAAWEIVNEEKDVDYILQRSSDGRNYTNVIKVKGIGNQYYQAVDNDLPTAFKYYYRVMLQEITGKITYSTVQVVIRDLQQKVIVFPTKVQNNRFYVKSENGEQELHLISSTGITVYKQTLHAGTNEIRLLNTFAKGLYIYKIQNQKARLGAQSGKIIIE